MKQESPGFSRGKQVNECGVCGSATPDQAFLCRRCGQEIVAALSLLPSLLHELSNAATRQTRVYRANGRRRTPDQDWRGSSYALRQTPSPVDEDASRLLDTIRNLLNTWTRHLAESRGVPLPEAVHVAGWLTANIDAVRHDEAAYDIHGQITDAARQAVKAVDRSPSPVFAGPCHHMTTQPETTLIGGTVYIQTVTSKCQRDLYRWPGRTDVRCDGHGSPAGTRDRGCGYLHGYDERREWWLDAVSSHLVGMTEVLDALPTLMPDTPAPPRSVVQAWVRQGRLMPVGQDHVGEPTYVGSELLALIRAYRPKTWAPKRRMSA